jgi:hypothetical protein
MSLADKKWAKLADEQQFSQLQKVHGTAANWRTALLAITSLFAVVTIIKGPEKAADLSSTGKIVVAILVGIAFAGLLVASGLAMYAAYGFPSREKLLTGETLREWTASEARTARRCLKIAAPVFFGAFVAVAGAIAVTWFDKDWFPPSPPAFLYVERTDTPSGVARAPICGELKTGTATTLVIKVKKATGPEEQTVPLTDVHRMAVLAECPG